jgi:hypothetical protein
MASASRESVFGVQTSTARKNLERQTNWQGFGLNRDREFDLEQDE